MQISKIWNTQREEVKTKSQQVIDVLRKHGEGSSSKEEEKKEEINKEEGDAIIHKGYEGFKKRYDKVHGGFGAAPKFPRPVELNSLFRFYYRFKDSKGT